MSIKISAATDTTPPLSTDMLPMARSGDTTARKISVGNFLNNAPASIFANLQTFGAGLTVSAGNVILSALSGAGAIPFVNGASGPLAQDAANLKYAGTVFYAPYFQAATAYRDAGGNTIMSVPAGTSTAIFLGNSAGNPAATGAHIIAIGLTPLAAVTSGADNIGIGFNALKAVTTNARNIAIGSNAGLAITAADNLAIGTNALKTNDASSSNVAIGSSALASMLGSSNGHNVAVGVQSGFDITTGESNVLLGVDVGRGFNPGGSFRFMAGSYTHPITDVFFGTGDGPGDGSAPVGYTIHGAGANSADTAGTNLILAGGQGCGTGKGGWIVLKYAAAGLTGSTQNALAAGLPVFANNAAAVSGGLPVGALYRSNADPDPVCIVH